jgi:hypothetical protein
MECPCGSRLCYVMHYFENYLGSFVVLGVASFKLDLMKGLCSVNRTLILTTNRKFKFEYAWPALFPLPSTQTDVWFMSVFLSDVTNDHI